MTKGQTDPWRLSSLILASAAVVTWATGFGGYGLWDYGFPFLWKTGGCPLDPRSLIPCYPLSISLLPFLGDLLFYAVIGYVIAFRLHHKKPSESPGAYGVVLLSLGLVIFIAGVIDEILGVSPLFLGFPQLDVSVLVQGEVILILGVILLRHGHAHLRRPEPSFYIGIRESRHQSS